jgi:hypothetical protein
VRAVAESRRHRAAARSSSEFVLLGGAFALAASGIGIVSVALARQRRAGEGVDGAGSHDDSVTAGAGRPELPDEPLGVPADGPSGNGEVELPGFPRIDPTHG